MFPNRDLTQFRRRRRGRRLVKNVFLFLHLFGVTQRVCRYQNLPLLSMLRMRSILNGNTKKLAVVVHVLQTTQNLVISRCCFAEDGKEMYDDL